MLLVLYVLFVVSGATGLVYQVAWMRELHLVLGASAPATALVLAVFMLGLAVGAAQFGRFMSRWAGNPWLAYGVLELFIAVFSAVLPFALDALDPALRRAYGTALHGPLRLMGAAAVLLPPTLCMGGTLPVMARALERAPGRWDRNLTRLYAANTAGAAVGAFLAPFVLLPALGLRAMELALPLVNVALGAVAIVYGGRISPPGPEATSTPDEARQAPAPAVASTKSRRGREKAGARAASLARPVLGPASALALSATSGFVVLLLEVAATRVLAVFLGQSIYGFGMMLTCFILGLALGAWLVGLLLKRNVAVPRAVGPLAIASALAVGVLLLVLARVPWWLAEGQLAIHGTPDPFARMAAFQFLLALLALLPPTLLLGTLFPLVLGSAGQDGSGASRRVGLIYGVNTLGAVTGSLLGGFVLVPALGPHGAIALAGAVMLACGSLLLLRDLRAEPARRRAGPLQVAGMAVAALLLGFGARPEPQVLARSPWLYSRTPRELAIYREEHDEKARTIDILAHDAHGTVAAGRYHRAEPTQRFFSVNGKIDGGTSRDDMLTQVSLATWPCFLFDGTRSEPKRALVIGLGTGVTAGAALTFPLESLDVVEISPSMPKVARQMFAEENRDALTDPRTRLIIGDGRHHLAHARGRYDVIISEPSNPWISGIGFLFTRECFTHMRDALTDGGVACQWLHLYDLTPEAIASAIRTFASVFPNSIVLMTQDVPSDLLLLGFQRGVAPDGTLLDAEGLERALERHPVPAEYEPYIARSMADFLAQFVAGPTAIAELTHGAPLNTDDNAWLEFEAPKQLATEGDMTPAGRLLGAHWEPADKYLTMPGDWAARITDRSRSVALYWRLANGAGAEVLDLVTSPEESAKPLSPSAATEAERVLGAFTTRFGESSLQCHVAGVLAELQPVAGAQPPMLTRHGPGFDPAPSREWFEKGARLDPHNLPLLIDLAANYEYGMDGERFGRGSQLGRAAALYRTVLERAPELDTVRARLAAVMARAGR